MNQEPAPGADTLSSQGPQAPTARPRPAPKLHRAHLVKRKDLSHDLMVVWFEPDNPFLFKPGQYCTLGLNGIERAYSIVSAPHEPALEIFIELVPLPQGVLTPPMWEMKEGEWMTLRPSAKGIFTLDPRYPNHLMVATVTGIAPYLSILRDYLHRGASGHRFYVLQGASYLDEFAYDQELAQLAQEHPDLITYVPTISRPSEERNQRWTGEIGRVNLITEKYLEQFRLDTQNAMVYACGHPDMIEDVKARLTPKGFKVKEERFWKQ